MRADGPGEADAGLPAVRFRLSSAARIRRMRRNLSLLLLGLFIFVGSALAMRVRQTGALFVLGAGGAALVLLSLRRLFGTARPLVAGRSALYLGTRPLAWSAIEAVSIEEAVLVVQAKGRRHVVEVADPAAAATEIARRAGLRPPRRGGPRRWERRAAQEEP